MAEQNCIEFYNVLSWILGFPIIKSTCTACTEIGRLNIC